tara:strand:- start:130 stop:741 length:612 start_codon:yes stop_codon:yes gene_type:complete
MEKILIHFDQSTYQTKKLKLEKLATQLNNLTTTFYKLEVIGKTALNLNYLLYNDNYINELISIKDEVQVLKLKNINELYKLYVDQEHYSEFETIRQSVKTEFEKTHTPLTYFKLSKGVIILQNKELDNLKEQLSVYAETPAEIMSYNALKTVCKAVNNFNEKNSTKLFTARGISNTLIKYNDGTITPTINGIKELAKTNLINT